MRISKFGAVGLFNFIIEAILFNVLFLAVGMGEVAAKVLSTLVSITLAYVLNKKWVFQHEQGASFKEAGVFFGTNLGCMFLSTLIFHWGLQWRWLFEALASVGLGHALVVNILNFVSIALMVPVRYVVYAVLFNNKPRQEKLEVL